MKNQVASQDDLEESKQLAIAPEAERVLEQIGADDNARVAALPPVQMEG